MADKFGRWMADLSASLPIILISMNMKEPAREVMESHNARLRLSSFVESFNLLLADRIAGIKMSHERLDIN